MAKSVSVKERLEQRSQGSQLASVSEPAAEPGDSSGDTNGYGRVTIEIPIALARDPTLNSGPVRLDGVDLTRDQSAKLRRIADGLDREGAVCETRSGRRRVTHWRHAVRWLLDQVEA